MRTLTDHQYALDIARKNIDTERGVGVLARSYILLAAALEESVKLQSHYAELLNMHDGGQRLGFANADAWLDRLRVLAAKPSRSATTPAIPEGATTKQLLDALLSGDDIVSKTGTEHLRGERFSLDRSPKLKE